MAGVELQQIGSYVITRLLSESSTGSVYQGRQPRRKDVIIKVLNAPLRTPEAREAFLTRAKQLKKLKHRQIAEVQDFGTIQGSGKQQECGYLVMQLVTGKSLRERFPAGTCVEPLEVKQVLSPIADALHYAHVNSVLHNNLHPGNLLQGERKDILLTGFSLLLLELSLPPDDELAAIPYMAPEHLRGQPTAASDQYALAVMVYEWLCGRRPYGATERERLLRQQEQDVVPSPRGYNDALSEITESVLLHALAPDPGERFPHIQAFADAYLRSLMGLPVNLETRPALPPLPEPVMGGEPVNDIGIRGSTNNRGLAPGQPQGPTAPHPATLAPTILRGPRPPIVSGTDIKFIENREEHISPSSHPTDIPSAGIPSTVVSGSSVQDEKKAEPEVFEDSDWPDDEKESIPALLSAGSFVNGAKLHDLVSADLCQGGVLSKRLPGYEERVAQIEMATVVTRALNEHVPAIVEAGTGTGKSLAYLVPIVHSGRVAIISTANKALQEQLFYKDIPFVQQHIKPFEAALVKGVGNYVCLDRVHSERNGLQYYAKNRDFARLLDIIDDPESTFLGDFETLGFQLPGDVRSRVSTDSDQCAWKKCDFFEDCYVRKMRERAELAQVIVVNHTLLLLDAAIGGFLLPERDVIVLDEAHHLEEEATRAFTVTINPNQVMTLLSLRMLRDHSKVELQDAANTALAKAWMRLEQVADPGYKGRANLQAPLEEGLKLASIIGELLDSLRKQRPKDLPEKEGQLYDKLLKRTQNLAQNIRTVFAVDQPSEFVYYVERVNTPGQRGVQLQVSAAPLDVTTWLREKLFDKTNVICTSATLATVGPNPAHPEAKGPNFAYYRKRIGLDPVERQDVLERILPLTFDYESNALLYLPRDLPEPVYGAGSEDYTRAIAREMYRLVKASRGRAFLLFSSKRMLEGAYELMSPHLDFPLLRQGDMTRIELTRRFREETGAVLFGLKSFWEGVDIAGEALSLVVIDKLPFDPPDDPVHEARVAQMKAAGENWFGTYVLPQAVLRLKQGLGRLLRSREDRGVMAILDTRLHTKGYGKMVLDALPPARRTASIKEVERFFL